MSQFDEPVYSPRLRMHQGRKEIFDPVRNKYVALTPEEHVRQHFIHYLITEKKIPCSLLAVEASLKYNSLVKRCDIVVYGTSGKPLLIIECKAPSVEVGGEVFQQVAMYNFSLKVRYLVVTNGNRTFACEVDHETGAVKFLDDIPEYEAMNI